MSLFETVLLKISKKLIGAQEQKINIARIITEIIGVEITSDTISLREGVVLVKTNPTIKFAIQLKRELLLETLKKEGITITTIS